MRVMIFGTFDDLHPGHIHVLDQAMKRTRDERRETRDGQHSHLASPAFAKATVGRHISSLYVVVARDENVRKIKGHAPLQTQGKRMSAIKEKYPDATVLLGHESDFFARIREVQPDLILLGYDQKLPPNVSEADLGVKVERLGAFEPEKYKSSLLRNQNK